MSTLAEQLRVDPRRVDWVASRDDTLHETTVSVMVGAGSDRHAVGATVWAPRPAGPHPLPGYPDLKARPAVVALGRVHCGSQRGRSGLRAVSLSAPVTCERCLANPYWQAVESLPEDVLTTDRMGRLVPKEA